MDKKHKLLFVCVENSNRSQMAEAFARIHGGDSVDAYSAGSRPSGVVNPKAIKAMAELGYDLTEHASLSLSEVPDIEYDFVATMGCGDECPWVKAKHQDDWPIEDPRNMGSEDFLKVRDAIEANVRKLLDRLSRTSD